MDQVALVAVMGGAYPSSEDLPFGGTEFNFDCGRVGLLSPLPPQCCMGEALECTASAQATTSLLPASVKVIFSGFEVSRGQVRSCGVRWGSDGVRRGCG